LRIPLWSVSGIIVVLEHACAIQEVLIYHVNIFFVLERIIHEDGADLFIGRRDYDARL
jgi:hypothetical protein